MDDQGIENSVPVCDGSDVVDGCLASFMERYTGVAPPSISTGIASIDRAIIGLRGGKMYVIAGRPGMGKTAIADSIRRSVVEQGYVVCEFSLEMASDEIGERELSFQARVNSRKVASGKEVTETELQRLQGAIGSVPRGLWWLYDSCFSMAAIVDKARQAKVRADAEGKRIGLIIIDYLQLLNDSGSENRQQSISACSRMTKLLSRELNCAIFALSQLNRGCEYREDKRPMMADIRESGSIEQDADLIGFVYREHQYDKSVDPSETEFIIRKQRSGPTGTVRIRFNPSTVHFDDFPETSAATPLKETE